MSKLISEEIVEAITLGDKEGFMSAFQSALAAKVSDALEIKKVEIASTLIAPASSEVVEEEVEQIDEAADYTLKHVGTSHPKDVTDDEDQPVKATEKSYEIHKGGKKVGELEHHHNEYGGHFYSGNLHGRRFPWDRNNNSLGGKNDAHSYLASALKSKWHTSKHSATNEEVEQIDELGDTWLGRRKLAAAHAKREQQTSNMKKAEPKVFNTTHAMWTYGPKTTNLHNKANKIGDYIAKNKSKTAENKINLSAATKRVINKEEVESIEEGTPEAKGQSRAEWRMGTADVIAKNNAKIAAKKALAKKKLLSGKGK